MEQNVYSVFDFKARQYAAPFFMLNDGQAIRAFGDAVNDKTTTLNKHPEDYALYRIGVFDTSIGKLIAVVEPIHLSRATDFGPMINRPALDVIENPKAPGYPDLKPKEKMGAKN